MFKNKIEFLPISHQSMDISYAEKQNKVVLNLFTCNCILDITVISSRAFLKF